MKNLFIILAFCFVGTYLYSQQNDSIQLTSVTTSVEPQSGSSRSILFVEEAENITVSKEPEIYLRKMGLMVEKNSIKKADIVSTVEISNIINDPRLNKQIALSQNSLTILEPKFSPSNVRATVIKVE